MAVDSFTLEEVKSVHNGPIVSVALFDIGMPRSQMRSDKAKVCIVIFEPNCYSSFVARHPPKARLNREDFSTVAYSSEGRDIPSAWQLRHSE